MHKELRLLAFYLLLIVTLVAGGAAWWVYDGNRTPAIGSPPLPPRGNTPGYGLLEEVFSQLDWSRLGEELDRIEQADATGGDSETAGIRGKLIERHEPVFERLAESLEHPFRYPDGYAAGDDPDRNSRYRRLARLYREKIRHHLSTGNDETALDAFLDLLDFGRRIIAQGPVSGMLTGIAVQGVVTNAFGPEIPRLATAASAEQHRRWETIASAPVDFPKLLEWEASFALHAVAEAFEEPDWRMNYLRAHALLPAPPQDADEGFRPGAVLRSRWLAFRLHKGRIITRYRDVRDNALAAAELPFSEGLARWPSAGDGPNERLADTLAVADRAWFLFLNSQAVNRLLLTSSALERHRIDRGEYPDSLDALIPGYLAEAPSDPFDDGSPIRYTRTGTESFTVYSIGPDGVDGGGTRIRNEDLPPDDPRRHTPTKNSRGDIAYRILTD